MKLFYVDDNPYFKSIYYSCMKDGITAQRIARRTSWDDRSKTTINNQYSTPTIYADSDDEVNRMNSPFNVRDRFKELLMLGMWDDTYEHFQYVLQNTGSDEEDIVLALDYDALVNNAVSVKSAPVNLSQNRKRPPRGGQDQKIISFCNLLCNTLVHFPAVVVLPKQDCSCQGWELVPTHV